MLLLLAAAHAADCEPYGSDKLVNDLQLLQLGLRNLDEATLSAAADRVKTGLPCLATTAPQPVFASLYRYLGTAAVLAGNNDEARRYFRSSLEIEPSYAWDVAELDQDSPIRTVFEEERGRAEDEPRLVSGAALAEGSWMLDGHSLSQPLATTDRPHVLQKVDGKTVLGTWVIDGNSFPPEALGNPATAKSTAKSTSKSSKTTGTSSKSSSSSTKSTSVVSRKLPPEKIPLIVGGAVLVAGAGGLYAWSFLARDQFDQASTLAEAESARTLTNGLVLGSGGALLVGLGVGYWGIALDGGAAFGISGSF